MTTVSPRITPPPTGTWEVPASTVPLSGAGPGSATGASDVEGGTVVVVAGAAVVVVATAAEVEAAGGEAAR
ncbi:hypothetical protein GCM10027167_08660 [Nocardia heshunensis]